MKIKKEDIKKLKWEFHYEEKYYDCETIFNDYEIDVFDDETTDVDLTIFTKNGHRIDASLCENVEEAKQQAFEHYYENIVNFMKEVFNE